MFTKKIGIYMDPTANDRQHRRLNRLKSEGVHRSTVFVHQECKTALDALRPLFLNPSQASLIQKLLLQVEEQTLPVNVSQVVQLSPFRYPGGKTWLVPELRRWVSTLGQVSVFVEPFAGGASSSLMIANEKRAERVLIGELDENVASVWKTIFESPVADANWLCQRILSFNVSETSVREELAHTTSGIRHRAWQTILRNRMNRGGILAPGAGLVKGGEKGRGLLSRWYPETLVRRIETLQLMRDQVSVFAGDAFEAIALYNKERHAAFLIDPPYTAGGKNAGSRLYAHHAIDHERLFSVMSEIKGSVMMTYDDAPEVRALAERYEFRISRVPMKSTHHALHKELILTRP